MKAKESLNTEKLFCKISVGYYGANGLDNKGRLWGWGGNQTFGLNNRNQISNYCISSPVKTLGCRNKFIEISNARDAILALDENSTAWAWGKNTYGSVGDGTNNAKFTPVKVYGDKTFCKISTGSFHSGGIDKNGRLWTWGRNEYGQLGNNSQLDKSTPVAVYGNKTFCKISFGDRGSLAIDKNGKLWEWGYIYNYDFGASVSTPVSVCGNKTFCEISGPWERSYAIEKNGKVWVWGTRFYSYDYAVIPDEVGFFDSPQSIVGNKTFCKISGNGYAAGAIDKNGQLWVWGTNYQYGLLGNAGQIEYTFSPISIGGQKKTFCQVSVSGDTALAIEKNARVWGWGSNLYGKLGDKRFSFDLVPRKICGERVFNKISAGASFSGAVTNTGKVYLWGSNGNGQDGEGGWLSNGKDYGFAPMPAEISGQIKTFCNISVGYRHTLAIDKNGRGWGWGWEDRGVLGNGGDSYGTVKTPVSIIGNKTFCQIATGYEFSFGVDKNNKTWGWGSPQYLGNNTPPGIAVLSPISITYLSGKTFCKISCGAFHTLALDKNGKIWTWGLNNVSQLGINRNITSTLTPVAICSNKTFCKIATNTFQSAAIDKNNDIWVWGYNQYNNLGAGSTYQSQIEYPTKVYGDLKFNEVGVAYGSSFGTIGLDQNGCIWLINNPPSKINSEVRFCNISVGYQQVLLTDENNIGWSFGSNLQGLIGNYNSFTPVRLYNI
jgi:alpha-tubulin suppressor-like RCC1 family protein